MRFRPCIDLHGGRVKQIVGSTLTDDARMLRTNFVSEQESDYYARLYREDNLPGGHVIMLGAGNEEAARLALGAYPGGLQLGGGITDRNAQAFLDAGAGQVIVTSFIFADGALKMEHLKRLFAVTGREKLVLDLSCRRRDGKYYIVTDRWQKFTTLEVHAGTLRDLSEYCCEFLVHAVDVEGKQSGIDTALIELLAEHAPIDCVYAGGIRSLADIDLIGRAGRGKIDFTVGSALDLFGGPLGYREVIRHVRDNKGAL